MNEVLYPMAVIAVVAIVTWILRAFPFLLFGNRPLPKAILYLGKVLPPAIMTVLVIYCLRDISFAGHPTAYRKFLPVLWLLLCKSFAGICIFRL